MHLTTAVLPEEIRVLGFKNEALDQQHICTITFTLSIVNKYSSDVRELLAAEFLKGVFLDQYL